MRSATPSIGAAGLARFLQAERRRYGVAPELRWRSGEVVGFTVTKAQRQRLSEAIGAQLALGALEDAEDARTTRGWAAVAAPTPLTSSPFETKLQSEALPGDPPLRRLQMKALGGKELVQAFDGTLGWVCSAELRPQRQGPAAPLKRAAPGQVATVTAAAFEAFLEAASAAARAGWSYRLGGRAPATGIDCSALVARLAFEAFDLVLPRHSGDQRRCGRRVGRAQLQPGDLAFATARGRRLSHVGVVAAGGGVVHACLSERRVLEEPAESFFERYELRVARRPWEVA